MFYDDDFCLEVENWLLGHARSGAKFQVLIGDPGEMEF